MDNTSRMRLLSYYMVRSLNFQIFMNMDEHLTRSLRDRLINGISHDILEEYLDK
jgi:hypothetical protein